MADEAARTPMKGDGKIKFMAHLDTFKELLAAGHQQRKIFEQHESELGMSYSQFNRYVNQYIRAKATDGHQKEGHKQEPQQSTPAAPASGSGSSRGASPAPAPSASDTGTQRAGKKQPVFQHDPSSGNKLEDLI